MSREYRLVLSADLCYVLPMTMTLPQAPPPEAAARLELACAEYARGKVDKVSGSQLAGVDFFAFQRALGERGISSCTEQMLDEDVRTLRKLFPR
jgi:predicted HTH domain antitoxin